LVEDGLSLTAASLTEGCFVHCAISDFVAREERLAVSITTSPSPFATPLVTILLLFSCSQSLSASLSKIPESPVLRGLDRLRETGFSDAEIEQFRVQFRNSRNIDPSES
jgi:hypothetical protein